MLPHTHCPLGCEHPQPFADCEGRILCGRCWHVDSAVTEMVDCDEEVCMGWDAVRWPPAYMESMAKFLECRAGADAAFASDWMFPLQRKRELEAMLAMLDAPACMVELGADKGAGVHQWLCRLPSLQKLIAVEVDGCPWSSAMRTRHAHVRQLCVHGSSHADSTVHSARAFLCGQRVDVLFIDGDKLATEKDFDAWLPLMAEHGTVLVHDINWDTPRDAYMRLCARGYEHMEIVDTTESKEAVARAEAGVPVHCPHEGWLRYWHGRSCGVGVLKL